MTIKRSKYIRILSTTIVASQRISLITMIQTSTNQQMTVTRLFPSIPKINSFNGAHLKNWVIEVYNDGVNWIEIDRNQNNSALRGPYKNVNFTVVQQTNDFYRFVRLLQIGQSWWYLEEHNFLTLCIIEFYGKLKNTIGFDSKDYNLNETKCQVF